MFSIVPASVSALRMRKNLAGEPALQMAAAKCLTAWVLCLIARQEEKQRNPYAVKRPAWLSHILLYRYSRCAGGRLSITFSVLFSRIFEVSLMEKTFS